MKNGSKSKLNTSLSRFNILLVVVLLGISSIRRVSAQIGIFETTQDGSIILLELIVFAIFGIITILNFLNDRNLGNSIISPPFIYLYIGLAFTVASRLFLVLALEGFYQVPMMTIGIYWHFILYISMIPFFIAIQKVADRTKEKELKPFSGVDWLISLFLLAIVILLFVTPETLGMEIMMMIMQTSIPEVGGLHFLAFFLSFLLSLRVISVVNKTRESPVGKYMSSVSRPFLIFIFITTLNHLTALLIESWNVIEVGQPGLIEQSFWIVGFIVMLYGYINLNSRILGSKSQIKKYEPNVEQTDIVMTVMNVLNDHVGNLAWDLFNQSVEASGISPNSISKENIEDFTTTIKTQSQDLIGEFPSRYLKLTIQKKINSLYI